MKLLSLDIFDLYGQSGNDLAYDRFSSGINIIFGPNGSGKTSTLRSIEALICGLSFPSHLVSLWEKEGRKLEISLKRDQRTVSDPDVEKKLPNPALAACYAVTIDDLFAATEEELASKLLKEAFGGIDFLRLRFGFDNLGKQHGFREKKRSIDLKRKEESMLLLSKQLIVKKDSLSQIDAKIGLALDAKEKASKIAELRELGTIEADLALLRARLGSLPCGIERLQGDEIKRLCEIDSELGQITEEISTLMNRKADFPHWDRAEISMKRHLLKELYENSVSIALKQKELFKARFAFEEECRFANLSSDFVSKLDIKELEKTAQILRCIEELKMKLGPSVEKGPRPLFSLDEIRRGLNLLQSYLSEKDKGLVKLLFFLSGFLLFFLIFGIRALIILPFGALFYSNAKKRYERLKLIPTSWGEKELMRTIASLEKEYIRALSFNEENGEAAALRLELQKLNGELKNLFLLGPGGLTSRQFIDAVSDVRSFYLKVQEYGCELELLEEERKAILEKLNLLFVKLGLAGAGDYEAASKLFSKIDEKLEEMEKQLFLAEKAADGLVRRDLLLLKKSSLLKDCGFLDERELRGVFSQYALFKELKREEELKNMQLAILLKKKEKLEEPLKNKEELELLALSYEALLEQKHAIQNELMAAGKESSLEDLKSEQYIASEELKDKVEKRLLCQSALYWIGELKNDFEKHLQSPFFLEAKRAFCHFTRGDYELLFPKEDDENPSFNVLDLKSRRIKKLKELSRGTRMQLVLALRVGYVLFAESLPLPFFFDEVLGTTDRERFETICQTLIEMARLGRQLFYFTCREDETVWKKIFSAQGFADYKFFELGYSQTKRGACAPALQS